MKRYILLLTAFILTGCASSEADSTITSISGTVRSISGSKIVVNCDDNNETYVIDSTDEFPVLYADSILSPSDLKDKDNLVMTFDNGILSSVQIVTED